MSVLSRSSLVLLCLLLLSACGSTAPLKTIAGVDSPAQVNAKLGLSYMQHGQFDFAEVKLNKALQQDPKLAEAHHYLAELYKRTERVAEARVSYRRAMKYSRYDMGLENNFAVFLCEQGGYSEAVKIFVKVASSRNYNRRADAYANAGHCAMRIPDKKQAEIYLRRALQINKKLPAVLYEMAQLSFEQQKYLSARGFMQRYAAVTQQSPQSLLLGVQVELKLGDRQAVDSYALQLSREFPHAAEVEEMERLLSPDK